MNLVAVYVPSHGNVMSLVPLDRVRILHRQDFLVLVGNDNRAGSAFDALLRACCRAGISSLNATF